MPTIHRKRYHPWMEGDHLWMVGSTSGMQHLLRLLSNKGLFLVYEAASIEFNLASDTAARLQDSRLPASTEACSFPPLLLF